MAKKNKKAVLEVDESALDRLEEKAKKAKAARQKHAPKTKKEAEEQGLKVVKTVPKNIFDPAKWPSKKDYFMVENELAVKGEDGKTTYKPNGFTRADFPTYKRDSYCYHRIMPRVRTTGTREYDGSCQPVRSYMDATFQE